jgi:AcrR family transcriptional regulator
MPDTNFSPRITATRDQIIAATRLEIDSKGILGLRVQDIAERAHVSVPLIYKYFGDREGLLSEVLVTMFDQFVKEQVDAGRKIFNSLAEPSVKDLFPMFRVPNDRARSSARWANLQTMAASVDNPALRMKLGEVQVETINYLATFLDEVQIRLTGKINTPSRELALFIRAYAFGFAQNDLLAEQGQPVNTDHYVNLMLDLFERAVVPQK